MPELERPTNNETDASAIDDFAQFASLVEQAEDALQFDVFYYLFTQLSHAQMAQLRTFLENTHPELLEMMRDAENAWKEYGISMGTIPDSAPEVKHLMFHLGRVKYFSIENRGGLMGVPNYYGFGLEYWSNIKKELRDALCSQSTKYSKDRKQLAEIGKTSITVGVPAIMAALTLPPSLAGIAIVLSVFISKVGINAFCRMATEDSALPSTKESVSKPDDVA